MFTAFGAGGFACVRTGVFGRDEIVCYNDANKKYSHQLNSHVKTLWCDNVDMIHTQHYHDDNGNVTNTIHREVEKIYFRPVDISLYEANSNKPYVSSKGWDWRDCPYLEIFRDLKF